jgi:hypothetical protein
MHLPTSCKTVYAFMISESFRDIIFYASLVTLAEETGTDEIFTIECNGKKDFA